MGKKILCLALVMAVAVTMFAFPAGASDSKWAGWIKISTPEELSKISSGNNYYLTNDINLKDYGLWQPIYSFMGTLDGNGYAIRNLTSTRGGLFRELGAVGANSGDATIKNLGLINVDVMCDGDVGALANTYGRTVTIENCYVTGKVVNSSSSSYAGGFFGRDSFWSNTLSLKNCYNKASVTSKFGAGGIIGNGRGYSLVNCINEGAITGDSEFVGGIAGHLRGSRVNNSYNFGAVKSTNSSKVYIAGGLVGTAGSGANVSNSATTGKTAVGYALDGSHTSQIKTNVPRDDFKKQETYVGFNFDRVWYIHPKVNNGYPILRTMMRLYDIPDDNSDSKAATALRITINLKVGDTLQLGAALNPSDSTDSVKYNSNTTSVATVNSSGLVTAKAKGTATVTVTAGGVSQRVNIRVT
ncbi:MAG: Ig-like domain-containing protein [Oscillospiraceae bacterium]|nr:Ig-like domain-containing protein [Oscillospiraceae bacterium]